MEDWTEATVLTALIDGNTVLDLVRFEGRLYSEDARKNINRILYELERQGKVRRHQPDSNKKPTWYHIVVEEKAKHYLACITTTTLEKSFESIQK